MRSLNGQSIASAGASSPSYQPSGYNTHHATPLSHSTHPPPARLNAPPPQTRAPTSSAVVVRHRESHAGLTNSYEAAARDGGDGDAATGGSAAAAAAAAAASPSPAVSVGYPGSPIDTLSPSQLSNVQRDYPAVYAALLVYEKAVRHHKEKYRAKESELLRCINVGEELLGQIDALKQRCEALTQERDAAVHAREARDTTRVDHERAAQADRSAAARAAAAVAAEERRDLAEQHETQCARLRAELQDALKHTALAQAERGEIEATLQETRGQLHEAEEHVRRVEDAYRERESVYAAQHNRDLQHQQATFTRQLAEVQQQSDVERETVLAESTVELERLQRALLRAEKELKEHQRSAHRSTASSLLPVEATSSSAAAVEVARLRRQIRQLEDINHDLQLQLRRRHPASVEGRLLIQGSAEDRSGFGTAAVCTVSQSDANVEETMSGSSNLLHRRLQEQNAHLLDKLQAVARQAQEDLDAAHEARLALQHQLTSQEAQLQLLRTSVVSGLEAELQRARENTDVAEAHSRELQEIADALEVRAVALHHELTQANTQLESLRCDTAQLRAELQGADDAVEAARADTAAAMAVSERKDSLIAQQQREKQQLMAALRTLQAETATIEGALTEMNVRHVEGVTTSEETVARLQERCVLLEHEVEAAQEERMSLCSRLQDAEEAVEVLKDAQRVSQAAVRDAQRSATEAVDRSSVSVEQLRGQQQQWRTRATAAEAEGEGLRRQLREVTQRLRDYEEEAVRKEEALRHSSDKVNALTREVRQLREAHSGRDATSREQWRQQYAQNTADRERLMRRQEEQIETLHRELQGVRKTATLREEQVSEMQRQRQQAQSALSEAVTSTATYRGRVQALEEELMRVEKERAEARAEAQRLTEAHVTGSSHLGDSATATTERVAALEIKLAACTGQLHTADLHRQRVQTTLLQLVLPQSADASHAPRHGWDDLVDTLDTEIGKLLTPPSLRAPHQHHTDESVDDGGVTNATPDASLPESCQRAAAALLRTTRDWVEVLQDEDTHRWSTLRHAVCAVFATPNEEAPISPRLDRNVPLRTSAELRDRLTAAQQTFTAAMSEVRRALALVSKGYSGEDEAQHARVAELTAALAAKEAAFAALQRTVEDLEGKATDSAQQQASLHATIDALRGEVAEGEARLAELERRLESRTTAAQAEREEWVSKWQVSQQHRNKERGDHETALRELRTRLTAADDAATTQADLLHSESEAAQQHLRKQLQELQLSATAAEAALHQQVNSLTHEKAQATQGLRRVRAVVAELEGRVRAAEEALQAKDAQLAAAEAAMTELKRAHHETLANGVAAEAFGQESVSQQVASLTAQLTTSRHDCALMEKTHAAEREELLALRRVNASLESRLAEVEEDRAPLRQQLHSLLAFADP